MPEGLTKDGVAIAASNLVLALVQARPGEFQPSEFGGLFREMVELVVAQLTPPPSETKGRATFF